MRYEEQMRAASGMRAAVCLVGSSRPSDDEVKENVDEYIDQDGVHEGDEEAWFRSWTELLHGNWGWQQGVMW